MTTHDTPEAALAAALSDADDEWLATPIRDDDEHWTLFCARHILAALPPGWCGHDGPLGPYYRREIARLRAAIQAVLDDAESQHPGGWGPDVTTVGILHAALAPSES